MFKSILLFAITLLSAQLLTAQQLKRSERKVFRYNEKGDSSLTETRLEEYAPDGTQTKLEIHFYNGASPQPQAEAQTSWQLYTFDASKKVGRFRQGKNERIIVNYLSYDNKKPVQQQCLAMHNSFTNAWPGEVFKCAHAAQNIKYFNEDDELSREDTFIYGPDKRLKEYVRYNYLGYTSKFSDQFSYTRKGLLKKWKTQNHWLTINIKGESVEKHSRRRLNKYSYNSKGNLKRLKGRYYDTWIDHKLRYDKTGAIRYKKEVTCRKSTKEENGKRKKYWDEQTEEFWYQEGRLLESKRTKNGKLEGRTINHYKDSLLVATEMYQHGNLLEKKEYNYESGVLSSTKNITFMAGGKAQTEVFKKFDKEKNVTFWQEKINDNQTKSEEYSYVFDVTKNVIERTIVNSKNLTFKSYFSYNEKNMCVREVTLYPNKAIKSHAAYTDVTFY